MEARMKNNQENAFEVYDEENDEYYNYCNICDKYVIKRFYNNHLKSSTHVSNIIKQTPSPSKTENKKLSKNTKLINDLERKYNDYLKNKKIDSLDKLKEKIEILPLRLTKIEKIKKMS